MATETQDVAAQSGGMPQLDIGTFPNQIFWLVVTLVIIYFILSRVALPRIGGALADRAGTITNDLALAEDLKQQAVNAEAAYEKALADARAEAAKINTNMRSEIQAQLDVELAKADAEISAKTAEAASALADIRANAMVSVRDVAKTTAKNIVATLGDKADRKDIADAVAERMKG